VETRILAQDGCEGALTILRPIATVPQATADLGERSRKTLVSDTVEELSHIGD
jgi:hypothetical protein